MSKTKKTAIRYSEDNWPKADTIGGEPWPAADEKPKGKTLCQVFAGEPMVPKSVAPVVSLARGVPLPDTASPTWKYVFAFACAMEHKLSLNRRKGDSAGWRKDGVNPLQERLDDEIEELAEALGAYYLSGPRAGERHRQAVLMEAADVANFSMMIADCITEEK